MQFNHIKFLTHTDLSQSMILMFYVDLDVTATVMNLLLPVADERAPLFCDFNDDGIGIECKT